MGSPQHQLSQEYKEPLEGVRSKPMVSTEGLLTPGTWAVPVCPLSLPASARLQGTDPHRDPDPGRHPEPRQSMAAGGSSGDALSSPFAVTFLRSPNRHGCVEGRTFALELS